jgi:para-aminobenzoate synthetase component 2
VSSSRNPSILVVDNYDSFVFTIVGYLEQLGADCTVVRNDAVTPAEGAGFDGVLVSPGPGTPEEAGVSMAMIQACAERAQPMLGVCLGHQALGVVMGATVGRAPELLHGKTSLVHHDGTGVLDGCRNRSRPPAITPWRSTRRPCPSSCSPTGTPTAGWSWRCGTRALPLHGVQFHPESVLTEGGHRILANWLAECGDAEAIGRSVGLSPLVHR